MTAREVMTIAQARENFIKSIDLNVVKQTLEPDFAEKLVTTLSPYKEGTCPLRVFYQRPEASAVLELGTQWRVTPSDTLIHELKLLLGENNIALQF